MTVDEGLGVTEDGKGSTGTTEGEPSTEGPTFLPWADATSAPSSLAAPKRSRNSAEFAASASASASRRRQGNRSRRRRRRRRIGPTSASVRACPALPRRR
uniref:Uncharacterized protein n=1 Tax=Oryza glumipatula TaxID=40148 RepID=A0A0D9YLM4_9ORYZ